jgi:hypothetical protein
MLHTLNGSVHLKWSCETKLIDLCKTTSLSKIHNMYVYSIPTRSCGLTKLSTCKSLLLPLPKSMTCHRPSLQHQLVLPYILVRLYLFQIDKSRKKVTSLPINGIYIFELFLQKLFVKCHSKIQYDDILFNSLCKNFWDF